MQTRTYTEKSNARRAARKAGVDPALVFETDDGFTFPTPAEENADDASAIPAAPYDPSLDDSVGPLVEGASRPPFEKKRRTKVGAMLDKLNAASAAPDPTNGHDQAGNGTAQHSEAEKDDPRFKADMADYIEQRRADEELNDANWPVLERRAPELDTPATKDDEGIPAFCKIPSDERKAAWAKMTNAQQIAVAADAIARNQPKAAPAPLQQEATTMAKTSKRKAAPTKGAKDKTPVGAKTGTLLSMLKGKGSTVEEMTSALGWLPHTLRARLSRLGKPKSKGGEGLKIARAREDGVTTYRIAA